jgi:ATP-binding cassette, subfamily B (MDR/TAP), member 1
LLAKSQAVLYYVDADSMQDKAAFYSYMYILIAGVAFVAAIGQYYGICGVGEKIVCGLRSQMYEALVRKPIGYFDHPDNAPGNLATMLADDVRAVHKAFGEGFAKQVMAVCTLIVGLVFSFNASWKISLVTLATFPLSVAASAVQMQTMQGQQ